MMRTVRKAIQSTLLLTLLVIGCTKPGSEFVGKWVNSGNTSDTLDVSRNGDQFVITGPDGEKMPATYANGTLQVQGAMGAALSLTYVKSSDTVTTPGLFSQAEYKRAK